MTKFGDTCFSTANEDGTFYRPAVYPTIYYDTHFLKIFWAIDEICRFSFSMKFVFSLCKNKEVISGFTDCFM